MAKVLIADDNPAICSLLNDLIKSDGHDVITAHNGKAAIEAISSGLQFDLVITDLKMPGADGNRVAAAAKEAGIERVVINTCSPHDARHLPGIEVVAKMTVRDVEDRILGPLKAKVRL
jgi:CheY-like chemotaxis protein